MRIASINVLPLRISKRLAAVALLSIFSMVLWKSENSQLFQNGRPDKKSEHLGKFNDEVSRKQNYSNTRLNVGSRKTLDASGSTKEQISTLWELFEMKESKDNEALVRTWPDHEKLNTSSHSFNVDTCTQKKFQDLERNQRHLLTAVAQNFNPSLLRTYYHIFEHHLRLEAAPKGVAIVTAASADHFDESQAFLHSMWDKFGDRYRILYYDVGLRREQVKLLNHKCSFCEYRKFNFSQYPPHVKILKSYSFKALIAQEVLWDHELMIWFDASIRFKKEENVTSLQYFIDFIQKAEGMMWASGFYAQTVMTHPFMFSFFNDHPCSSGKIIQLASNFYGINGSPFARKMILIPWVACALEPDCMYARHPIYAHKCLLHRKDFDFSHCHRYDQAALTAIYNRVLSKQPQPPWQPFLVKRGHKEPLFLEKIQLSFSDTDSTP